MLELSETDSDVTALVNMAAVLSSIVCYFLVVAPLRVEMKTVGSVRLRQKK